MRTATVFRAQSGIQGSRSDTRPSIVQPTDAMGGKELGQINLVITFVGVSVDYVK